MTAISSVYGQIEGLKKSVLSQLDKLYRRRIPEGVLLSYDLAEELCALNLDTGRELTLLVDAKGHVDLVMVGAVDQLAQGNIIPPPDTVEGLSRFYCVHSRPGWKPPSQAEQVTLLQYHFPVLVTLAAGTETGFSRSHGENPHYCDAAWILNPSSGGPGMDGKKLTTQETGPLTARALSEEALEKWQDWAAPSFTQRSGKQQTKRERAFLIGMAATGSPEAESTLEDSLDELRQLAKTAGADIVGLLTQNRSTPDPRTYLGSGKAQELALLIQEYQANVIIADEELSPVQQRNLEQITQIKVIDRTEVILDIFAQRAHSREGQIQVELAQLQYLMPRLRGRGRMFSQQTSVGAKGGIATRGPGETKLETDRRALSRRITQLEQEAEAVVRHRQFQRQSRRKAQIPVVALVGYTNAGKSTLMRALTHSDVLVEDKLFATLDPTTRKLYLPSGQEVLLSDTVGFIRKLPTFLIKAFRATLEEAASANLLLHVWDISHPDRLQQLHSVQEILKTLFEELQVPSPPLWTLCNKIDRLPHWEQELASMAPTLTHPIAISAQTGEGLPELTETLARFMETALPPHSV